MENRGWSREETESTAVTSTRDSRVYDVSDPYYIKEIAYFIPPNPNKKPEESYFPGFPGPRNATTEDCIVDDRGNIIIDALDDGFYILRMKEDK